jgi:hypothetical protein
MRFILLAIVLSFALIPEIHAQTIVKGEDKTVFMPKTTIDFRDVRIDGEVTRPEGLYALHPPKFQFNSLIKLRSTFAPELQKTIERL